MLWRFLVRNKENTRVYGQFFYDWDKDIYSAIFDQSVPTGAPAHFHILSGMGIYEMNDRQCRMMLRDRVIPANRQNIGTILREMNVPYYHECFILKNVPMSVMDDAYFDFVGEITEEEYNIIKEKSMV